MISFWMSRHLCRCVGVEKLLLTDENGGEGNNNSPLETGDTLEGHGMHRKNERHLLLSPTRGPWTATLALIKVDEIGQN